MRGVLRLLRRASVLLLAAAAIGPSAARAACLGDPAWFPLGPAAAVAALRPDLGVAASGSLLQLVDASAPAAPRGLGEIAVGAAITAVAAVDDELWVTTAEPGLLRIDVADPTTPVVVSVTPLPAYPYHVAATATAVVVAVDGGVLVFSTPDNGPPGLPTLIAAAPSTSAAPRPSRSRTWPPPPDARRWPSAPPAARWPSACVRSTRSSEQATSFADAWSRAGVRARSVVP